jgi:hypothetical protein
MRYAQNFRRVLKVPLESAALLATLMLRGAQTAAELRANSERLWPISDASAAEAFLQELATRPAGALAVELPRQPGSREPRWMHLLCGPSGLPSAAGDARPASGAVASSATGLQVDLPETQAEVTLQFARYRQAFVDNDTEALNDLFWESPKAMLDRTRLDTAPAPTELRTRLTCFGRDSAMSLIDFTREGDARVRRQSQWWAHLPQGWRVVSVHEGDAAPK